MSWDRVLENIHHFGAALVLDTLRVERVGFE